MDRTEKEWRRDLERANRLVLWMAGYIRHMAPVHYGDCYKELNEHFIMMGALGISTIDPSKPKGDGK